MTRDRWIECAIEQYKLHGVSEHKARLWAESLINNNPDIINECPYVSAEIDYRN